MLTVSELLTRVPFNQAELLTGRGPFPQEVRGITLADRDMPASYYEHKVVLSSCRLFRQMLADKVDLKTQFPEWQAAVLFVRGGRREDLPAAFLAEAEAANFPILLIRPEIDYDQIIHAVCFELFRNEGYHTGLSFEENFLQELVASKQDKTTYKRRGAMLGLRRDELLCALLLQPGKEVSAAEVCEYCTRMFRRKVFALTKNERILLALRMTTANCSKNTAILAAKGFLVALSSAFPNTTFRMGIGRCYDDLSDFGKSFSDACCALSFSMIMRNRNEISHFDDLGVYRILFDYKNRRELFALYQDTIGTIRDYDRKNQTEYLKTIRTYFQENYSINNTAKKLYTHYNTIVNRFQKIQTLFNIDMYDESERINLYVCLVAADSQKLWNTY